MKICIKFLTGYSLKVIFCRKPINIFLSCLKKYVLFGSVRNDYFISKNELYMKHMFIIFICNLYCNFLAYISQFNKIFVYVYQKILNILCIYQYLNLTVICREMCIITN